VFFGVGSHAKARRREGREEESWVLGLACMWELFGGGEFLGLGLTRRKML
jgi:hypothetical protein